MKLSSDHLWQKIWVANFFRIHNLPLMMTKWEKVIFSWTFGLFLTFVIECGHIPIPNRDFWGYSSRPQIGDLVTNHSLLWDPLSLAWDGPKMALFWPNMAGLSPLQSGPKGFKWPKMANLSVGFSGENYLLPQKHIGADWLKFFWEKNPSNLSECETEFTTFPNLGTCNVVQSRYPTTMLDQAHDHVCSYPQWLKLEPFWLNILADTFVGLMVAARRWSAVLCTNGEASAGGWRSWRPAGGAHSCRMLEAGRRRMLHHCYIKPPNPTFCSSLGPWTPGGEHGRLGEEKQSIETFYGQARRASSQKKEFDVQSAKERTTLMICEESSIRKFQPKLGKGCQSQETSMF